MDLILQSFQEIQAYREPQGHQLLQLDQDYLSILVGLLDLVVLGHQELLEVLEVQVVQYLLLFRVVQHFLVYQVVQPYQVFQGILEVQADLEDQGFLEHPDHPPCHFLLDFQALLLFLLGLVLQVFQGTQGPQDFL